MLFTRILTKNRAGLFYQAAAYIVRNGLAPAVAGEPKDNAQEDYKDNNPPNPAPATVVTKAAETTAAVAATATTIVETAAVIEATGIIKTGIVKVCAAVVTVVKVAAATGRYLLFTHNEKPPKFLWDCFAVGFNRQTTI